MDLRTRHQILPNISQILSMKVNHLHSGMPMVSQTNFMGPLRWLPKKPSGDVKQTLGILTNQQKYPSENKTSGVGEDMTQGPWCAKRHRSATSASSSFKTLCKSGACDDFQAQWWAWLGWPGWGDLKGTIYTSSDMVVFNFLPCSQVHPFFASCVAKLPKLDKEVSSWQKCTISRILVLRRKRKGGGRQ